MPVKLLRFLSTSFPAFHFTRLFQGNPLRTAGLFSRFLNSPTHRMVDGLKDIYPLGHFAPISITWEARPTFYLNIYFYLLLEYCLPDLYYLFQKSIFFLPFKRHFRSHGVTERNYYTKKQLCVPSRTKQNST